MQWIDVYNSLARVGTSIKMKPIRPQPRVVVPNVNNRKTNNQMVEYLLNDPTLPIIKNIMAPIAPPNPRFTVVGYVGGGFPWNSIQGQAASVYTTIVNMINYVNTVSTRPMTRWAATNNLAVLPRAGRNLNAYYNRTSLSFFFDRSPKTGLDIYTANSSDAVAHELGHAILDSFRPEFFNMPLLEVWAFHESFGDCMSLSNMILNDEAISYALNETANNLRQDNIITKVAEEIGLALSVILPGQNSAYLRDANNTFNYVAPNTLPRDGSADQIFAEPHSFSKIMTGAYYDILVMMYNDMKQTMTPLLAVKTAANLLNKYFFLAIQNVAVESRFYKRMAHAMLWADFTHGRIYHDRMWEIFANRNMISQFDVLSVKMSQDEMAEERDRTPTHIRLCECCNFTAQTYNPAHHAKIMVPYKSDEIVEDVKQVVDYLSQTGGISDDPHTPFEIINGRLVRSSFFCGECSACRNNKFQPEFYKPYKPENNAGCGCSRRPKTPVERKPAVKRGCAVRYTVVK